MLIEKIEKINPIINIFCTPSFKLARESAEKADKLIKSRSEMALLNGILYSLIFG